MRKETGTVGDFKIFQGEKVTFVDATDDNRPYKAKILHINGDKVKLIVYNFEGGGQTAQNSIINTTTNYIELDIISIIKKVMKNVP